MPVDSPSQFSGSTVAESDKSAPRKTRPKHRYTAFDSALIKAARDKLAVNVHLSLDTGFTDEDGFFTGGVKIVDVYSVLFVIKEKEIWVAKPHIVAVEILS